MPLEPITIRERLQDYEFTDEQEMTLTLELLNRIEKDIDELRAKKTREGFSEYVALGGLAATLFLLFKELNDLTEISLSSIGIVLFAGLLILKISWAFYQILAIDQVTKKRQAQGRFFWSNDLFFENRMAGLFQLFIFLICGVFLFRLSVPLWITISTAVAFLFYALILGGVFILSFRKEPFSSNSSNKWVMVGLPSVFIAITIVSVAGLISQLNVPIGKETSPYMIAGLLLTLIFFIDRLIRLGTPSLSLGKLERLRYDIVFLRADLNDAWIRYEVIVYGHDISEELRADMDDIVRSFNMLDYGESQKEKVLLAIQDEVSRLEIQQKERELTDTDFITINSHKLEFFVHLRAVERLHGDFQPRLNKIAKEIHRISRSTQEWERSDEYQSIFCLV